MIIYIWNTKPQKIFHIYIFYLMYKHLYNWTVNLDVAFLLSFRIAQAQ